ncbi:MAG: 30S ribosomal protein S20 [Parcubacteria group bacterium]
MAITRGAKKAHRASLRKRVFNIRRKDKVSSSVKSLKKLITLGKKKEAEMMMRQVQKAFDKAVKGKTLKKNTASRKKSGLSKLVKKLS